MPKLITGGCACGAVRYTCHAEPLAMYNCHCECCQHASGSVCAPILIMAAKAVQITGEPRFSTMSHDSDHPHHGFCHACGSPLFARSQYKEDVLLVKAASLDDSKWFIPVADIWSANALPWAYMNRHIPKVFKTPPVLEKPNAVTT